MHYLMWSTGLCTRIYTVYWAMSGKTDFPPKIITISAISPVSNSTGDRWAYHGLLKASRHQVTRHLGKIILSSGCLSEQAPLLTYNKQASHPSPPSWQLLDPKTVSSARPQTTKTTTYQYEHHDSSLGMKKKQGWSQPHCQDRPCSAANSWLLHVCPDITSGG